MIYLFYILFFSSLPFLPSPLSIFLFIHSSNSFQNFSFSLYSLKLTSLLLWVPFIISFKKCLSFNKSYYDEFIFFFQFFLAVYSRNWQLLLLIYLLFILFCASFISTILSLIILSFFSLSFTNLNACFIIHSGLVYMVDLIMLSNTFAWK